MKNVFLLMIALGSIANAADRPMVFTQRGFQVSAQFGWGLTQPSNTVYEFATLAETPNSINKEIEKIVQSPSGSNIYGLELDYSNLSSWKSLSAIIAGLNLGYKWLLNSNQYSVTANVFAQYNGVSMTSGLTAGAQNFETFSDTANGGLIGSIGSAYQDAGNLKLSSGPVFGFNCLLARELSWGNVGLLLGMKFNPYKLTYIETKPEVVAPGASMVPGFLDVTMRNPVNQNVILNIGDYVYYRSKTQLATGLTIGFATNYYISDHVSAGLSMFYDIYAPITFNLENINISPYVFSEGGEQMQNSGKIKFQNNTIGVVMNVTYSFGAN